MPARIRFLARYGNGILLMLIAFFTAVGVSSGDDMFPLLSASFLAAIAMSVHAAERMAALGSADEWRKTEVREAELRGRFMVVNAGNFEF